MIYQSLIWDYCIITHMYIYISEIMFSRNKPLCF